MISKAEVRGSGRGLVDAWRGFWFRVEPAYTIGLIRIAFGALVILWALELKTNLYIRFGSEGVLPQPPAQAFTWSVFELYTTDDALLIGWIVLMVAALALTVGWHSRIAAIVVFIMIVSFERRNPWVFNAGDMLIRIEALFIALAPCGAALSLDQRRRSGSFFSAEDKKIWALRLMQVQVSIIYISTVVAKLKGETWQDGTAVSYSLRQYDMLVIPTPGWVTSNLLLMNAMTWGTLLIEFAIGVLVWNRRCRPWVLAGGVILHLSIMLSIEVGLFSLAVYVLYLAFIPSDRVKAVVDKLPDAFSAVGARLRRRQVASNDDDDVELPPPVPKEPEPAVTVSRKPATPDAARRNGHTRVPKGVKRGRPADARQNGAPRRGAVPLTTPVQVVDRVNGDESPGRHARPAGTDLGKGFHWPDDVRTRLTD